MSAATNQIIVIINIPTCSVTSDPNQMQSNLLHWPRLDGRWTGAGGVVGKEWHLASNCNLLGQVNVATKPKIIASARRSYILMEALDAGQGGLRGLRGERKFRGIFMAMPMLEWQQPQKRIELRMFEFILQVLLDWSTWNRFLFGAASDATRRNPSPRSTHSFQPLVSS